MNVIMPEWKPSERLQRLAGRRGMVLGVTPFIAEAPLIQAIEDARKSGRLSVRTANALRRRIGYGSEYWTINQAFLDKYPTSRAFVEGLQRDDWDLKIRNIGPVARAEIIRAFTDE